MVEKKRLTYNDLPVFGQYRPTQWNLAYRAGVRYPAYHIFEHFDLEEVALRRAAKIRFIYPGEGVLVIIPPEDPNRGRKSVKRRT